MQILSGRNRAYNPYMKQRDTHSFWYGFNVTAIILIVLFLLSIPLFSVLAEFQKTVSINVNASLVTKVSIPTSFSVDIINEAETPLNAVEFELHYDPKSLRITDVIPQSTLCEERFIISNTIDHASGTIFFQCGTVIPFTGKSGNLAKINAIPLSSGTSSITFASSTTHVLAHDGYGTDVTAERKDLVFTSL